MLGATVVFVKNAKKVLNAVVSSHILLSVFYTPNRKCSSIGSGGYGLLIHLTFVAFSPFSASVSISAIAFSVSAYPRIGSLRSNFCHKIISDRVFSFRAKSASSLKRVRQCAGNSSPTEDKAHSVLAVRLSSLAGKRRCSFSTAFPLLFRRCCCFIFITVGSPGPTW